MNFETQHNVSLEDYMAMITSKTAVLLGEAMRLGAIMAGASEIEQQMIYDFGRDFGIAFQIQDDILDLYGDPKKFGKKPGGDVLEGKKTYLYLKALELADADTKKEIHDTYYSQALFKDEKVDAVKILFDRLDIKSVAKSEMNRFFNSASIALNSIEVPEERKTIIRDFAKSMMVRDV
jgi:geranylgeranyl diphosphate synthase type II